jgi:hypothetical protein
MFVLLLCAWQADGLHWSMRPYIRVGHLLVAKTGFTVCIDGRADSEAYLISQTHFDGMAH